MNMSSNTILITGATSGIGLALAERFLELGNTVIICGRRQDRLQEIQQKQPQMHVRTCDVANESERVALFTWATETFPQLNVLINNAGIQRRIAFPPEEPWSETVTEIETNLNAPIHLSYLFTPHLEQQANAAILMVSSGLAFVPSASMPVYCATKAGLHSFTLSARHALKSKGIDVIEIIPPAVATDLGGPGLHTGATPVEEFADAVMNQLGEHKMEITYGFSAQTSRASREDLDTIFQRMNR
jgi:uncharacterized oxidoreductase